MADVALEEFIGDHHDAIVVAVQERLRRDASMIAMAAQRGLSVGSLVSQVLGFWLQAIRTDLALGSTTAMAQNLGWLVSLRDGHDLQFDDTMVTEMFNEICVDIDARLDSEAPPEAAALRVECADYRARVDVLIGESFPDRTNAES